MLTLLLTTLLACTGPKDDTPTDTDSGGMDSAMPTTEDIEELVVELGLACERWLGKHGFAGAAEVRSV